MQSKLEHYQLMQRICMIIGPICACATIVFGLGWNHYSLKVKEEENKIKAQEQAKVKEKEPQTKTQGDYVAGNKNVYKKSQIKMKEDNSNAGNNKGNIGGTGNTVNNYNIGGNNYGVNGPVNVNYEKPFTDQDKKALINEVESFLRDNPNVKKSFSIITCTGSNAGRIPDFMKDFLISEGYTFGGSGTQRGGTMHEGISIEGGMPDGSFALVFGHF
ncbi:hypothetical protein [Pedobacter kyonggii]|uniref:Uncharacterized protein n=1 Tax=Pedobacter kyonggii TaxID=1926871 RepID=A0A4Q9H695_9SPHI|nr:hypothetical protein [Pedobacter kyonggii]TBO35940.1 hypothetical protein EYS08_25370 [Pedobacter kyonggii]